MWRSSHTTGETAVTSGDLDRAARLLSIRSLREATGLFAGDYVSAFRGSGIEFEESRPYVPGDDVRSIDWITLARTGEPYVKRFREERNHRLAFALDVSTSMAFGSTGRSKAEVALHALALLGAVAARAGDRTRLLAFDADLRARVPGGRGRAHTWSLIRSATRAARQPGDPARLAVAFRALRSHRHGTLVLLSDFRDPAFDPARSDALASSVASLRRHREVIAAIPVDPLEVSLPRAGRLRIADPAGTGDSRVLDTRSAAVRDRYREACAARRAALDAALRRAGAEVLWLPCARSPLETLGRFFAERVKRRPRAAA